MFKNNFIFYIIIAIIGAFIIYLVFGQSEENYTEKILQHRKSIEQSFKNGSESPIENKSNFAGLNYFAPDKKYKVLAQPIFEKENKSITLTTSTDENVEYNYYCKLEFLINDTTLTLTVFADPTNPEQLFVPFSDNTNGLSTYGAGRYLPLTGDIPVNEKIELDFNLAYNPYCAYNSKYTCPVPPAENRLNVSIKAGEKNYH